MSRTYRDVLVVLLWVVLGVLLVVIDRANVVVLQSFAIGLFLVAGSHITRRVLFHRLDLQTLASKAGETSVGAALVVASVCAFLVSVMWVGLAVLR